MTQVKVYFPSQYLEYNDVKEVVNMTAHNVYITLADGTELCLPRMWTVIEEHK